MTASPLKPLCDSPLASPLRLRLRLRGLILLTSGLFCLRLIMSLKVIAHWFNPR